MLKDPSREVSIRGTRAGQGWCIPRTVRRFGSKLLAQQLWCLGRDIEHVDENLLLRFGFQQFRDSEEWDRSTCYRLDMEELHIALWGFGMFFGHRELGGLFLGRMEFCPDWAPIESISLSVHWPDDLPIFGRPNGPEQWFRARELWSTLLLWIGEYEEWTVRTVGIEYRRQCVSSWLRPFVAAELMKEAWKFLGKRGWECNKQTPQQALKKYLLTV